ncbi:uncharacterized protein LOC121983817 [Zingiber officinale]|uniref:uncharacterized protein LOC121983817 n=1 Tax=Zingiber officinale TaxID=94328 RepID=UPI001C4DC244|nr:uncharacterized protein LOC121983817 [Zingiber officinale]
MGRRKSGGTKAEADGQKSHGLALGTACVVGDRMGVDGEEMEENAESSNLDDSPLIGADNTSAGLRLNAEKKSIHEVSYSFLIHDLLLVAIISTTTLSYQTKLYYSWQQLRMLNTKKIRLSTMDISEMASGDVSFMAPFKLIAERDDYMHLWHTLMSYSLNVKRR